MPDWLIPVIVVDLIITVAVVWFVVQRRRQRMGGGGPDLATTVGGLIGGFKEMAAFANERHARIGEYMRANWSGAPEQLPQVLGSLLEELEREALHRNISLDRDMLKTLVATSLRHHRIGRATDVGNALQKVA
jgi:hypothetical protein